MNTLQLPEMAVWQPEDAGESASRVAPRADPPAGSEVEWALVTLDRQGTWLSLGALVSALLIALAAWLSGSPA